MQATSDLYKEILSGKHEKECRLAVGRKDTPLADLSAFYGMDSLITMNTTLRVFSKETPTVGCCVSGEINVEMLKPAAAVPRQAKLVPQVRLTDGSRYSEWLSKGVFFVDTRTEDGEGTDFETLTLHGYDSMLKAEQDYPESKLEWPAGDLDVVKEIAAFIGVDIDTRTIAMMTKGYAVQYPGEYSCRETLGYIAAMYGGSLSYNNHTWGGTNSTGVYVGPLGIQLGKNFKVDANGNLEAVSGTFSGTVRAGSIQYGGNDGTLSGAAISAGSLSTYSLTGGIQTSLGYADYANSVINGTQSAPNFSVAKSGKLSILGAFEVRGATVNLKRQSVLDGNGNAVTIQYLAYAYVNMVGRFHRIRYRDTLTVFRSGIICRICIHIYSGIPWHPS